MLSFHKNNKLLHITWITLTLLICCFINDIKGQQDFQFDNDDQVVFTEATDIIENIQNKNYEKEIQKCLYNDDKIYLTFVLRSQLWSEIGEKNKDIAIQKLSNFFAVPKNFLSVDDVTTNDIHEITKLSTERGLNQLQSSNTKLGRLQFVIGCDQIFSTGQLIANQLPQQMKDGLISEISGLDFGWWVIWMKNARTKRQAPGLPLEGSGEDDYEYDDEEDMTEVPSTPPTHGHRHHHGEQNTDHDSEIKSTELINIDLNSVITTKLIDNNNNNNNNKIYVTTAVPSTRSETSIIDEIEESVSQLESDITKTIENNTNKLKEADDEIQKFLNVRQNNNNNNNNNNKLLENNNNNNYKHKNNINIDDKVLEEVVNNIPIYEQIPDDEILIEINTKKNGKSVNTNNNDDNDDDIDNTNDDDINLNEDDIIIDDTINENKIVKTIVTTIGDTINNNLSMSTTTTTITTVTGTTTTTTIIPQLIPTITTTPSSSLSSFITEQELLLKNDLQTTTPIGMVTQNLPVTDNIELITTTIATTTITVPTNIPITTTIGAAKNEESATDINPVTTDKIPYKQSDVLRKTELVLNKSPVATTSTEIPVTSTDIPQLGGGIETTTPDYIEYDDDDEDYDATTTATEKTTTQRFTIPITIPITTTQTPTTTVRTTIPTTTEKVLTTTEEYEEPINHPPFIKTRLPKLSFSAGQFKTYPIPIDTFSDEEDGYDLTIELFQENKTIVEEDSWIQYNPDKREIYALPLEEAVSKWNYLLYATDKGGSKIFENIDVTVQQNKYLRSANHEISVGVKLTEHFKYNIDWQIRLMNGIVQTLGDANSSNIIVRKIRLSRDHNSATFVFTNVTLPRNECPEKQMDNIVKILDGQTLANYVRPSMTINHVSGKLVNSCEPMIEPTKPTSHSNYPTSNHYPIVRNPIDRINATVGQLLVFKVPSDTFFDDEDKTDVIQNLKTINDTELHPKHWLQFDSKNTEFYGIPKSSDISENQYVLYGADRGGLKGRDVLVVVVSPAIKRDYSVLFEMTLGITYDRFNNSLAQRRFVEHISKIFGDHNTSNIQIRSIRSNHYTGNTIVSFYNTTLYRIHQRCPDEEIEILKNKYVHKDGSIRDATRELLGNEYNLLNMSILPIGTCQGGDTLHHDLHPMHPIHPIHTIHPTQVKTEAPPAQMKDDYLLTFVLPAVIILTMLLLASIVACVLHRRRLTGKMELGDEEERRSFRSKGIPVIFQDELDEKPEIGNKSPIIMKDEKPPLLPPSYNSTNPDEDDLDDYVPPPAVLVGGRETRGKSSTPVTPSYRKPPPYVSP